MGRRWWLALVGVTALASVCTGSAPPVAGPSTTGSSFASSPPGSVPASPSSGVSVGPSTSPSPSTPPVGATLASGAAFPEGCPAGSPKARDTAVFVSGSRAWALNPSGARLTCLFQVVDPGPFAWGPLGDRAIVAGLAVVGLPGAPTLAPLGESPPAFSWGRPTGKSIVFVTADAEHVEKVHLDGEPLSEVTPLGNARYLNVAYHPSGLAFAFAVERGGKESLWIATNEGEDAQRVVFSEEGTTFGPMGFRSDGVGLFYAALHADGHTELHVIDLTDTSGAPVVWGSEAGQQIFDVWPGAEFGSVAFTAGASCDQAEAMVVPFDGDQARPILPASSGPTHALGWLDPRKLLVASGPCAGPFDLTAVDVVDGTATPLVFGVDVGAVRTAAPTPPPPLPSTDPGSGFA